MIWKSLNSIDDRNDMNIRNIWFNALLGATMISLSSCACSSSSRKEAGTLPETSQVKEVVIEDNQIPEEEAYPGCDSTAVKDSSYRRR